MTELQPGNLLNSRYLVVKQLGQGGMGEVYLAEDQSLANQVAVKANHNLSAHATAQFIHEARLLASLKHPNLPRVIDYFTDGDSQYLVMDFIPGEDLRSLVEQGKSFSLLQVLHWADQLGNALNYLHTQNPPIYHRDVKPANIKLTPGGDVVLVDFGIAKTGDASQETLSGAWGFTPGFAPPEQVSGLRTGPYSDQFSLAATLYYMLAGKQPIDSAQRMIGSAEYIPLRLANPHVPEHVSHAIDRALEIKPESRFATITDFTGALANTHPIPEPSSAQRTVIASRQHAAPPPPGVIPPFMARAPDARLRKSPLWLILALLAIVATGVGGFFFLKANGIIGASPAPLVVPSATDANVTARSVSETIEPSVNPNIVETSPAVDTVSPTETEPPASAYTPVGTGGKVAYVSNYQADGYYQVWLIDVVQDADGSMKGINPVQVTFSEGNKSKPSFSPDGGKLIYSGPAAGLSSGGIALEDDIWMLDLTQPDPQPVDISLRSKNDRFAAWSPTGEKIAFTSYYREDNQPQLVIMNPDGSNQVRLSEQWPESYATWSPNDEFLIYVQSVGGYDVVYYRDKFSLFDTSHYLDRTVVEGRLGLVTEPNLSRDGSLLAYTRTISEKKYIYTAVWAEKGAIVTALTNTGMDYSPYWSPDRGWLLFTSNRDGDEEIYIMDNLGQKAFNISSLPSQERDPAWQPVKIEIFLPVQ